MSSKFLLGLGALGYLSTQGNKRGGRAASRVTSKYATGGRSYADNEEIHRDFLFYARLTVPSWQAMNGGISKEYSDGEYPAGIWGWRCYSLDAAPTIFQYAGANNCTVNELCARYGQARIYIKYGIENYSDYTTSKIWIERWGNEIYEHELYPHPVNDKLRIDKYGVEWYYISKEDMYDYYLRPAREEHLKMMQRQLFKE